MKKELLFAFSLVIFSGCASAQITDTIIPTPATSKCVYVYDQAPTTGYPNPVQISAGYNSVGGIYTQSRTYIYFDLSAIPTNAIITSATLNFFFDSLINPTTYSGSPGQNGTKLSMVNQSWNQDSVTWSAQPTVDSSNEVIVGPTAGIRTDITNINVDTPIQMWVSNPSINYGWRFWQITEYTVQQSQEDFASSFDTLRPAKMPFLVVAYHYPSGIENIAAAPVAGLYPNPAHDMLTLYNVTSENFEIQITDILGQKINCDINGKQINTSHLPQGTYILQYTDLNSEICAKFKFIKI
jgi:hypothetical protein